MAVKRCELKGCRNALGPGAAKIGFEIDGVTYEIKGCEFHTQLVTTAPPGTWQITKDRELKPIPARYFIKKGRP